jgi:hypothetical protein
LRLREEVENPDIKFIAEPVTPQITGNDGFGDYWTYLDSIRGQC